MNLTDIYCMLGIIQKELKENKREDFADTIGKMKSEIAEDIQRP